MPVMTLFADRPVGDKADLLWFADPKARKGPRPLRDQLDQIAETLVAALHPGANPHASLTAAITGACGSGKSSALNVLRDLATQKARAIAPGAEGDAVAARLVVCPYVAPDWQITKLDARSTLVGAMLVSLAGSEIKAVSKLLASAASISPQLGDASEPSDAVGQRMWASVTFNKIAETIAPLRDVASLLREGLPDETDHKLRVLAMLIDDLDRCEPAFVYTVLSELEQLHDLDNFFFIVAADPSTIRRAITEGGPRRGLSSEAVEQELARLVQHTVSVPRLEKESLTALLGGLFAERLGASDPFAEALLNSVPLLLLGLPELTPRALKRCLNFLAARVHEPPADVRELKIRIKRALLAHTWPDFFRDFFVPMTSNGPSRNLAPIAMLHLTATRAAAVDGSDRRLAHELAYVCEAFPSLPWRDLPLALLRFLSAPPELPAESSAAAQPDRPASTSPRTRAAVVADASSSAASSESAAIAHLLTYGVGGPSGTASTAPDTASTGTDDDKDKGIGPDIEPDDPVNDSAPASPTDTILDRALSDVLELHEPLARLDRAAQAFLDLAALGPSADAYAWSLAAGLWPSLLANPRDAAVLTRVLDRYVAILQDHHQHRKVGKLLDDAYRAAPASPSIREKYRLALTGAGDLQSARLVESGAPVEPPNLLADDPDQAPDLTLATARVKTLVDAAVDAARS